jgi:hypothetical protein
VTITTLSRRHKAVRSHIFIDYIHSHRCYCAMSLQQGTGKIGKRAFTAGRSLPSC